MGDNLYDWQFYLQNLKLKKEEKRRELSRGVLLLDCLQSGQAFQLANWLRLCVPLRNNYQSELSTSRKSTSSQRQYASHGRCRHEVIFATRNSEQKFTTLSYVTTLAIPNFYSHMC